MGSLAASNLPPREALEKADRCLSLAREIGRGDAGRIDEARALLRDLGCSTDSRATAATDATGNGHLRSAGEGVPEQGTVAPEELDAGGFEHALDAPPSVGRTKNGTRRRRRRKGLM